MDSGVFRSARTAPVFVEHNRGHHVRIATRQDPASARFGESLWAFLPRSTLGGFRSSLALERERLARKGKRWFSPDNNLLQAWSMSAALFAMMVGAFGVTRIPAAATRPCAAQEKRHSYHSATPS